MSTRIGMFGVTPTISAIGAIKKEKPVNKMKRIKRKVKRNKKEVLRYEKEKNI